MREAKRVRRLSGRIVAYILLVVITVVGIAPIAWITSTSLKPQSEVFQSRPHWIPPHPTVENYVKAFRQYPLLVWLKNSLLVAAMTLVVAMLFDVLAAYAFARLEFKGRNILLALIVASIMLPGESAAIPLYRLARMLGIADTPIGIVLPQAAEAIGLFLIVQFFRNIPKELSEASSLDGCSHWTILWRIIFPLSIPAISVMTILTFVSSWNNFFWPLVVTFSSSSMTLPVGLSSIMSAFTEAAEARQYGLMMAISLISCLPAIIVFLILQRRFIQAITMTGIKG
jgi:ABC-type glycerol-3-phosphate transport system permease component